MASGPVCSVDTVDPTVLQTVLPHPFSIELGRKLVSAEQLSKSLILKDGRFGNESGYSNTWRRLRKPKIASLFIAVSPRHSATSTTIKMPSLINLIITDFAFAN